MTTNQAMFDGGEMTLLHTMFRREFGLMPELVRGAAPGDLARAGVVGDHIGLVSTVLHFHHGGEDEYVWPLLVERRGDQVAPLVELMEEQHAAVAGIGGEVAAALETWRGAADAGAADVLAGALDRLLPVLREHLAAEEERIVPLMERTITAAEWSGIVEKGAAGADPESLPLGFGLLLYEGDPAVVDAEIANMPEQVRPVIRELAAQAFAAHAEQVYGTATPPRSTEL